MNLVFGHLVGPSWPLVATDGLLRSMKSHFPGIIRMAPPPSEGVAAADARIREALEQPITMSFPHETPLEEVLTYVKSNTQGQELGLPSGIPIYVDPSGLQEVEKTHQSPVTIDVQGVPLRTTLHLILKQLGLTYGVEGGLLLIVNEGDPDPSPLSLARPPIDADPFLVIGYCLLALLAAGVGGLLAPLVCGSRRAGAIRPDSRAGEG